MDWKKGDIDGVVVKPLKQYSDSRGWLAETFRSDELPEHLHPAMSYVSLTHPGETRGPHEHIEQTDMFCFTGPGTFLVRLWDNRKSSPTRGNTMELFAGADNPCTVIIPPHVVHGYKNVSDADAIYINYPNRLFAGKGKSSPIDEIRHEDDDPQHFVL